MWSDFEAGVVRTNRRAQSRLDWAIFRKNEDRMKRNESPVDDAGARIPDLTPSTVRFSFVKPDADEVFVAGSFNNWNPTTTRLNPAGHGRWVTELVLPPGRYEYQFVADGRWMPDFSREVVINPFGQFNSVLVVPRRETRKSPAQDIDPKWRLHYKTLIGLRERLLASRRDRMDDVADPLTMHGSNFAESASDELDHDLALAELSATQDALYEIEQALKRIVQGEYGKCEVTGKPIAQERLRAVPWTRFCAEVESELESQGALSHACIGEVRPLGAPVEYHPEEELDEANQET